MTCRAKQKKTQQQANLTAVAENRPGLSWQRKLLFALTPFVLLILLLLGAEWCFRNVLAVGRDFAAQHKKWQMPTGEVPWTTRQEVPWGYVVSDDPLLHHRWTPLVHSHSMFRGIDYHLYTNKQGWLEMYDVAEAKPGDTIRIFLLGDSNTEGVVNSPKKWADIVEQELNREWNPKGLKVEVINTGTSSYSPIIFYIMVREKIMPFSPDILVVNVDMTDVVNDYAYAQGAMFFADGTPYALGRVPQLKYHRMGPRGLEPYTWPEKLHEQLREFSALYFALSRAVPTLPLRAPSAPPSDKESKSKADWLCQEWNDDIQANVAKTQGYLEALARLSREKGVDLVISGVPHYPQFTGQWSTKPHDALRQTAQTAGVPFLDTYNAIADLVKSSPAGTYYWSNDPTHFNEEGNRLYASLQLKMLRPIVAKRVAAKERK